MDLDRYSLTLPRRVEFGWSVRSQLPREAARLGHRAWLVVGSRTLQRKGVIDSLVQSLADADMSAEVLTTSTREPLVEDVDQCVRQLQARRADAGDVLVAVGGGAAMDLAKAVAAMATNSRGESVREYLEGVGSGRVIEAPPLPLIALPTTAGTGSEATRNAVISSHSPPFKKSLRSERMVPDAVLIDPELCVSNPPAVTAHSGMDAITQLIESRISRRSNAFTAALCMEGLSRALPALPIAFRSGNDRAAREAMSHAAFLSGAALANAGLGLAHGVAAALGVHCNIPHGLACAVMLPAALRANREVCEPELAEIAGLFPSIRSGSQAAAADAMIHAVDELNRQLGIPTRLSDLGVQRGMIPQLARSSHGNSLSGNPREISDAELISILNALCD